MVVKYNFVIIIRTDSITYCGLIVINFGMKKISPDYKEEAYRQLSDKTTHKTIEEDPTLKFNHELNNWLEQEDPCQNISTESVD